MRFTRKRGRPSQNKGKCDLGTPELIYKRAAGLTSEAIDLCLEKSIINESQHWCALHFRWLHSIRFGVAKISTSQIMLDMNHNAIEDDPIWRQNRESEYSEIIKILAERNMLNMIIKICVSNVKPNFLTPNKISQNISYNKSTAKNYHQMIKFKEAMDIMTDLWKK